MKIFQDTKSSQYFKRPDNPQAQTLAQSEDILKIKISQKLLFGPWKFAVKAISSGKYVHKLVFFFFFNSNIAFEVIKNILLNVK